MTVRPGQSVLPYMTDGGKITWPDIAADTSINAMTYVILMHITLSAASVTIPASGHIRHFKFKRTSCHNILMTYFESFKRPAI